MVKFSLETPFMITVILFMVSVCSGRYVQYDPPIYNNRAPKLIEMSHPYNNVTVKPPNDRFWPFVLDQVHKGVWEGHGGIWWEMNNFRMNEHAGTHLDSPSHFSQGGNDPSQIPLERLYRLPAVVINIVERAKRDPHTQLLPEDLMLWESKYGRIPPNAAILMNSKWGLKYGTDAYSGIIRNATGAIIESESYKYPSISPAAAQWIVDNRPDVSCVGVDSQSLEKRPSFNFMSHVTLLSNDILGIENVANVHQLPENGAIVSVMPIRIEGGSGAAARIVGEINPKMCKNSLPMSRKRLGQHYRFAQLLNRLAGRRDRSPQHYY